MNECEYCIDNGDSCDAAHDYLCTRAPGHNGPHVACGTYDHVLDTWTEPEAPR